MLQDKYNIGVLTVNIGCMWVGTILMEKLTKARLSPVSKPRHINSIFTVNTPILYIQKCIYMIGVDFIINLIIYFGIWLVHEMR